MREYDLNASKDFVALDGRPCVVGVGSLGGITNNQTRSTKFRVDRLVEWSKAVSDAFGVNAEVVFTPDAPMVATVPGEDCTVGLAVAPVLPKEKVMPDD